MANKITLIQIPGKKITLANVLKAIERAIVEESDIINFYSLETEDTTFEVINVRSVGTPVPQNEGASI